MSSASFLPGVSADLLLRSFWSHFAALRQEPFYHLFSQSSTIAAVFHGNSREKLVSVPAFYRLILTVNVMQNRRRCKRGRNFQKKGLTTREPCAILFERSKIAYARVVELADSLDSGSSVHSGRAGSSPASRTTSEQALYRLLRLFQKSERAHAAAPPSKSNPLRWASLWFLGEDGMKSVMNTGTMKKAPVGVLFSI